MLLCIADESIIKDEKYSDNMERDMTTKSQDESVKSMLAYSAERRAFRAAEADQAARDERFGSRWNEVVQEIGSRMYPKKSHKFVENIVKSTVLSMKAKAQRDGVDPELLEVREAQMAADSLRYFQTIASTDENFEQAKEGGLKSLLMHAAEQGEAARHEENQRLLTQAREVLKERPVAQVVEMKPVEVPTTDEQKMLEGYALMSGWVLGELNKGKTWLSERWTETKHKLTEIDWRQAKNRAESALIYSVATVVAIAGLVLAREPLENTWRTWQANENKPDAVATISAEAAQAIQEFETRGVTSVDVVGAISGARVAAAEAEATSTVAPAASETVMEIQAPFVVAGVDLTVPKTIVYPNGEVIVDRPFVVTNTVGLEAANAIVSDFESYPNASVVYNTDQEGSHVLSLHSFKDKDGNPLPGENFRNMNELNVGEVVPINGVNYVIASVKRISADFVNKSLRTEGDEVYFSLNMLGYAPLAEGRQRIVAKVCEGEGFYLPDGSHDYSSRTLVELVPADQYEAATPQLTPEQKQIYGLAHAVNQYSKENPSESNPEVKLGTYLKTHEWYTSLPAEKQAIFDAMVESVNNQTYLYGDKTRALECMELWKILAMLYADKGVAYKGDQPIEGPAQLVPAEQRHNNGDEMLTQYNEAYNFQYNNGKLKIQKINVWDSIVTYEDKNDMVGHVYIVIGYEQTAGGTQLTLVDANGNNDGTTRVIKITGQENLNAFLGIGYGSGGAVVVP